MKKNKASKKQTQRQQRRRTRRRYRARTARPRAPSQSPQYVTLTASIDGSDHGDDDCPMCRAERELGIVPGEPMTQQTYDAFRRRVDEIIAEEGMPQDAVMMTGEELTRRYDWIAERLRQRGEFADLDQLDAMTDRELARHMALVRELSDAYDRLN